MVNHSSIRVLHIMSSYGGGISTFINNIASEIGRFNIIFDVVCLNDVPQLFVEAIQKTGGDVYKIHNPKQKGWAAFRKSYQRVLKLYDYQVIHCHISGYRAMAYKFLANNYSSADFIIHAHYYIDVDALPLIKKFQYYLNQQVNQNLSALYVGCSRQAVQSLFGYNIETADIVVIPNSIDPDRFLKKPEEEARLRNESRQVLNIGPETILVGQIGRLTPIKNHRLTLQIANLAKKEDLKIQFLIAGEGDLREAIEQSIETNHLTDYVRLIGRVDIEQLLPALDVVLFPSFSEGLGTVAVESQAAGIPLVCSDKIPVEADLNLHLMDRLGLQAPISDWLKALLKAVTTRQVEVDRRRAALIKHNYTNEQAAKLYATLVAGQTNF